MEVVDRCTCGAMRGEWTLTGDAVVFDNTGRLLNAQHRLRAIADSEISGRLVVLVGVPVESQDVMDSNLTRKVADALRWREEKNVHALAAALNVLFRLDYIQRTGNVHYSSPADRPTTHQLLTLFEANHKIVESKGGKPDKARHVGLRTGASIALHYRFSQLANLEEADAFFDQLATGNRWSEENGRYETLLASDPVARLRSWLINEKLASKGGKGRSEPVRELAMICKAWNQWREGKQMASLTWHYGARSREAFPNPK